MIVSRQSTTILFIYTKMSYEESQAWLQKLMMKYCHAEEDECQCDDNSDDNEEDFVEERNGDSDNVQELDYLEITSQNGESATEEHNQEVENENEVEWNRTIVRESGEHESVLFYTSKSKTSLWKKHCPPINLRSCRSKSKNIITQLPGPKAFYLRFERPCGNLEQIFWPVDYWNYCKIYESAHWWLCPRKVLKRNIYKKHWCIRSQSTDKGLLYLATVKKMNRLNCEEIFSTFSTDSLEVFMSQQRFLFLIRHLRFYDYQTRDVTWAIDKLAPIREVFQQVNQNCKQNFSISHHTTIDDMLVAFRGKCPFWQYIPSKPAKYGIKIFAVSNAIMFYTANMGVYVGKQPKDSPYDVSNSPYRCSKYAYPTYQGNSQEPN